MTDANQPAAWPAGSRVAFLDRTTVVGTIQYNGLDCPEDGMNTYRVKFDNGVEGDFCESVLFKATSVANES